MRVRLRFATIEELPPDLLESLCDVPRLKALGFDGRFAGIGTGFTVFGLEVSGGNLLYRIGNPPHEEYLIQCLAVFFEVVDGRPSQYWRGALQPCGRFVFWPPSWLADCYHDRLADGDPVAMADFLDVRNRLNSEAKLAPEGG